MILAQVASTAGVQAGSVSAPASTDGMPGTALITKLLGWAAQLGLWAAIGSILAGAIVWGLAHNAGNSYGSHRGRNYVLGGVVGAILVGIGPSIVNSLYTAAK